MADKYQILCSSLRSSQLAEIIPAEDAISLYEEAAADKLHSAREGDDEIVQMNYAAIDAGRRTRSSEVDVPASLES